ncbi:11384_t:CDS:2 [Gigaspora margarita]|uniref:11384_t:CDS:1 n=1 Tax=Gigaspora margarita TaxID=4874 RepID=A0ABN7UN63_GIGMA|nr:11384_t:CDS:2 [Gigaspora margarita]
MSEESCKALKSSCKVLKSSCKALKSSCKALKSSCKALKSSCKALKSSRKALKSVEEFKKNTKYLLSCYVFEVTLPLSVNRRNRKLFVAIACPAVNVRTPLLKKLHWPSPGLRPGDGGVDLFGNHEGYLLLVQCKKWRRKIGPGVLRELEGVLSRYRGATIGIIVVPSKDRYTSGTWKRARSSNFNIILTDLDNMCIDLSQFIEERKIKALYMAQITEERQIGMVSDLVRSSEERQAEMFNNLIRAVEDQQIERFSNLVQLIEINNIHFERLMESRRESNFDVEDFNPSRWLNPGIKSNISTSTFLPFVAGPKNCMGLKNCSTGI